MVTANDVTDILDWSTDSLDWCFLNMDGVIKLKKKQRFYVIKCVV